MEVIVDVLDHGGVDIAGLTANPIAGIANVVAFAVVTFHTLGTLARPGVVLHHNGIAVRAGHGVLLEQLSLAALLGIVAGPPRHILRQPRRGPVIHHDVAHLLRHYDTSRERTL